MGNDGRKGYKGGGSGAGAASGTPSGARQYRGTPKEVAQAASVKEVAAAPSAVPESKPMSMSAPAITMSLVRIPAGYFKASYAKDESVPKRMLWINAEAVGVLHLIDAAGFRGELWVTDIYRSPMESYTARLHKGPIVAPAGLSGHNYGISVDFDVEKTKKALGVTTNELLRSKLAPCAFLPITSEFWHFNMVFNPEHDYFVGLYRRFPSWMQDMRGDKFVSKFSELIGVKFDGGVRDIQKFLSLKEDGALGPMTFMSATMLAAARNGRLPIQDPQKESITLNFNEIWR